MSNASSFLSNDKRIRLLLWGEPKTKKTWWAMRAAEAGYNVLLIDGDDGAWRWPISDAAMSRINIVNCLDDTNRSTFKDFMSIMARNNAPVLWDNTTKSVAQQTQPEHSYLYIDKPKLSFRDVIVVDSWKALVYSTLADFARSQNIDMSDADKVEWDGYGFEGRFLDFIINWFHKLPCHVIVINHSYNYDKRSQPKKGSGEKSVVLWSKTIPISSSANHSFSTMSHWTDIVYMERISESLVYANTGASEVRAGGCRHYPSKQLPWDKLGPEEFFQQVSPSPTDGKDSEFVRYIEPGSEVFVPPIYTESSLSNRTSLVAAKPVSITGSTKIHIGAVGGLGKLPASPLRK